MEFRGFELGLVFGQRPTRRMWVFACVRVCVRGVRRLQGWQAFLCGQHGHIVDEGGKKSMAQPAFMNPSAVYQPASFIKSS